MLKWLNALISSKHCTCKPNAIELHQTESIFDNKSFKTASHFWFQFESLKINLNALNHVNYFLIFKEERWRLVIMNYR